MVFDINGFFSSKVNVLCVRNGFIEITTVRLSKTPKIIKHFRAQYDESTVSESINLLLGKIKTKSVRLLLGQEFAYVVNFSIPSHIQGSEERLYVYRKLSELIPDVLNDNEWDYRESEADHKKISIDDQEKKIIAFALVKNKYSNISNVLDNLPVLIDAVEPEEISLARNPNPIIGIALKNDIKGKDNNTLNIKVSKKNTKFELQAIIRRGIVAIVLIALTLLLDLIFRGWLY